jgi:HEAT repeat protein
MSIFSLLFKPDIARLRAKKDVKGLIKALSYYKDINVRRDAVKALAEFNDPVVIEPLIELLESFDSDMRDSAIDALAKIKNIQSVSPLIDKLKRSNEMIINLSNEMNKDINMFTEVYSKKVNPNLVSNLEQKGVHNAREQLAYRLASAAVNAGLESRKLFRDKVVGILQEITSKDFGYDVEQWQKWLEQNR